jgi:hypothetical protein
MLNVMHALVLTITRHGLSPTQPCATRLESALSVITVSMWWGGFNVYAGVPPFLSAFTHILTVGHRFYRHTVVSWLPLKLLASYCVPLKGFPSCFWWQLSFSALVP